ncbi:heavy metal translocating P-type ATPase [Massilibacteroides sp.]|uniref:heavy metal translocating P-type ATPase n=1 Tax=Massilibacteroides sp. TaxID=2034766 RepID=UPI00262DCAEB|nr:heavy metal translocating P-type ATPase [Massilibacteroides sp.]MDD4514488.1 heavy metal translocating P-type ATPase [Massilibacteroides sp.]
MGHSHEHEHGQEREKHWKKYLPASISFILLLTGLALDHFLPDSFFKGYVRLIWYIIAYLPVGFPVLKESAEFILQKDFFNEFTLMSIATIGAFAIGEYPEGVAVMLFYSVGELFQDSAVSKAQKNIKALLDIRPDSASVLRNGAFVTVKPEEVKIGEKIRVKPGERVPLDGILVLSQGSFNTSALTGESKPKRISDGETALAGMINLDNVVEIEVTKTYSDSSLAKILELVQHASSRKAKTELLIRRFARIYTPAVFFLAVALTLLPYFFVADYVFSEWLYRALVFLVISCPCALVISVPLGYFGGIGAASKHGVLFKGANYLDLMTHVNTVVMDKTGTLTHGVFDVQEIHSATGDDKQLLALAAAIESFSNHPIAKAITAYTKDSGQKLEVINVKEIPGHGLEGELDGKTVLAGNVKLLKKYGISYDSAVDEVVDTNVVVAYNNEYIGYITIADKEKEDAADAITQMKELGIRNTIMLSGDKSTITQKLASKLGLTAAYGDLLPEEKVSHIEELKADKTNCIAFVGDGINDAPALALSDVGIAMGGMGSDAAIEVADVIIQTDQPSKIATAIRIAKYTRSIVLQNIVLAISIKLLVLLLGALGIASMWGAVFADVGVALLAILNSVRGLGKKF